jgi:hypothetical protein
MLKLIARNKYKLMVFIIGLYLLVDVLQHKGQARVLFPKKFPAYSTGAGLPKSSSTLINTNKHWKKGVNSKALMQDLNEATAGFECDIYFDTVTNIFHVQHDADKSTGTNLDDLLELYGQKKMNAGIWLDIKNLADANAKVILSSLIQLRNKYGLHNKLLTESGRADLLTAFSDSGFYTAYYTPLFNPYQITGQVMKYWADSISTVIKTAKINALSGYYFQYPFLQHYFPEYPVLIWADNAPFRLVNKLFKQEIAGNKSVYIALYP